MRPKSAVKTRLHLYIDTEVKEEVLDLAQRFRLTPSGVVSLAVSKLYASEGKAKTIALQSRKENGTRRSLKDARSHLRRRMHSE